MGLVDTEVAAPERGQLESQSVEVDGDADVVLVHSREDEERFVSEGWGVERHDVM